MKTLFVAHGNDAIALRSLEILSQYGQETRIIEQVNGLPAHSIAIFGTDARVRNKFLRLSKHRMTDEEIAVPEWARKLPFVVAVNTENALNDRFGGLRVALKHMADVYGSWGPWMRQPEAPWNPRWKNGERHSLFDSWHSCARDAVNGVSCIERLIHRMQPVFTPNGGEEIKTLIMTGCALFNQPHTDVVDSIVPDKKRAALESLGNIIHDAGVSDVRFVMPDGYLLRPELRDHFHPFMFMGLNEVAQRLGIPVSTLRRIGNATHMRARSDDEIAEALQASAVALERDIVQPLRDATGVDIASISYRDYIDPYIERAWVLAQKHQPYAEAIYLDRVRTRPSYRSLDAIDRARGLRRTISNNAFYIAEAMFLRDTPAVAVVNFEFADSFWKGLEPLLAGEIWGDFRPLIGMVPEAARQPWGY